MTRIMFVCHGNICRSPMAEFIMKDILKRQGIADRFTVMSSAVSAEELGNPVYPPARAELAKHGLASVGKYAVRLITTDYDKYDYIIGMDRSNLSGIMRIIGADPEHKVHLLLDFTDSPHDVADPWYCGKFDVTYSDIYSGCQALLEHILQKRE